MINQIKDGREGETMKSWRAIPLLAAYSLVLLLHLACDANLFDMIDPGELNTSTIGYIFTPTDVTIPRGGSIVDTLVYVSDPGAVTPTGISVQYTGSTAGISVNPPNQSFFPRATIVVSVDATVPTGTTYQLTFDASAHQTSSSSIGLAPRNSLTVHVVQGTAPDFGVSVSPQVLYALPGLSGTAQITIDRKGTSLPITLSLSPPAQFPYTVIFNPNPATGTSSTMTVTVDPAATHLDYYAGLVQASGNGLTRTAPVEVNVPFAWQPQANVTLDSLAAIFFIDATRIVVVGGNGSILLSADHGSSWSQQRVGSAFLRGVSIAPTGAGFAVGDNGAILRTLDGAQHWTSQPPPSGYTANLFRGVVQNRFNTGEAVIVGKGVILHTTDGGVSWANDPTVAAGNQYNSVASSFSFNTLFVVGTGGVIYKSTNLGSTWQFQTSGTSFDLNSVSSSGSTILTAVGNHGTILHTTDGVNWNLQPSGTTADLYGVFGTDPNHWYVVGDNGTLLYTQDGGATWVQPQKTTTQDLHGIGVDGVEGMAVGWDGVILRNR
jgi:photosystem II stability/assembly factor-like uncharacterized protein